MVHLTSLELAKAVITICLCGLIPAQYSAGAIESKARRSPRADPGNMYTKAMCLSFHNVLNRL